jgi:hypothetical protein
MGEIVSRRYQPNPDKCCEACVFGRGEHAAWCPKVIRCSEDATCPGECIVGNWTGREIPPLHPHAPGCVYYRPACNEQACKSAPSSNLNSPKTNSPS